MPIIIICGILICAGVRSGLEADKHYNYKGGDIDNMLREMTGKSKAEKRKILKRYGRK